MLKLEDHCSGHKEKEKVERIFYGDKEAHSFIGAKRENESVDFFLQKC